MLANERISIRTTTEAKATIERACQLAGVSMNSFIMDNAYQKAIKLLESNRNITLTADEWDRAVKELDTPSNPSEKVKGLFERGYKVVNQ